MEWQSLRNFGMEYVTVRDYDAGYPVLKYEHILGMRKYGSRVRGVSGIYLHAGVRHLG